MSKKPYSKKNSPTDVNGFLDEMNHPLRKVIDDLRRIIKSASADLEENVKWNGPNFVHDGEDRITMKIYPPTQIQLIFHRGATVLEQPPAPLIEDNSGMLVWRGNDRAIASFRSEAEVIKRKAGLTRVVRAWIEALDAGH